MDKTLDDTKVSVNRADTPRPPRGEGAYQRIRAAPQAKPPPMALQSGAYARDLNRLLLLEISRPESRLGYVVLKGYLKHVIPTLTRLLRRSPEAQTLMVYYWATIEHCVEPAAILAALHEAGLEQVARRVELGVFSDYTAQA